MRALEILQPLWVLLMLGVGLCLVTLLVLGLHVGRKRRAEPDGEIEVFPDGIREAHHGIPAFVVVLYLVVGLSAIGHVIWTWLSGSSY